MLDSSQHFRHRGTHFQRRLRRAVNYLSKARVFQEILALHKNTRAMPIRQDDVQTSPRLSLPAAYTVFFQLPFNGTPKLIFHACLRPEAALQCADLTGMRNNIH